VQQEQQAQQQQQQLAADLAKAQGAASEAVQQITRDLPGLTVQQQLAGKLQAADMALALETSDYNDTKALAGPTADCTAVSNSITKVSDAESAVSDATSALSSSAGDVASAASTVTSDVDAARQAQQTVQQRGGSPDITEGQQIEQADNARRAASAASDAARTQAQTLYTQANDFYGKASSLNASCNENG